MSTTEFLHESSPAAQEAPPEISGNTLFPVFLKLETLRVLVVGGGHVGQEKLGAILGNSPNTPVTLVAEEISEAIKTLAKKHENLRLEKRAYRSDDLNNHDIIFSATGDRALAQRIVRDAHDRGLLVNTADTPDLCDFYLSSIVRKGDLKIAISTNGKSPTLSKRLREIFSEAIPAEETQEALDQLEALRQRLSGDFAQKVKQLNAVTRVLIENADPKREAKLKRRRIFLYTLSALALMITGHLILTFLPLDAIGSGIWTSIQRIDQSILLWILCGFTAQLIDGSLGMAYGVSTTTFLMAFGISPAVSSASMHASEIFTTGASSLVYLRMRNVNMRLFRLLLVPGAIGAIAGATFISLAGTKLSWLKPLVAVYTLTLGVLIIRKAMANRRMRKTKVRHILPLSAAGGFLDSVGGGGWGPIVTTSLVASGRDLRYTIGSAHAAKFFVALISSVTFFFMIGLQHWTIILGLVIGGLIAAPISIRLSTKISIRNGLILVGLLVIVVSLRTLIQFFM